MVSVEAIDPHLVLVQVPRLQAIALNILEDRDEEVPHGGGEAFQLGVEGIIPQLIIDVSYEVDEAFLLPTADGIEAGIKIRNQDPLVPFEHFMHHVRLSRGRHAENDIDAVGEHPNVVILSSNVDSGVINVDERTVQYSQ